jgi:hypothetical protein
MSRYTPTPELLAQWCSKKAQCSLEHRVARLKRNLEAVTERSERRNLVHQLASTEALLAAVNDALYHRRQARRADERSAE